MLAGAACVLLIAAASDLSGLGQRVARLQAVPGCELRWTFASSGTLARQIAAGADYDVYLSANQKFVEDLAAAGHVHRGSMTTYARGRLALWSKRRLGWKDLAQVQRISIANPQHAPYGLAAKQALERAGLWTKVESRVVFGENVRQALQFAATGNADAALVAWSLVKDRPGASLVPEEWHAPILQAGAVPRRARRSAEARRFLQWLMSEPGRAALEAHGLAAIRAGSRK